MESRTDQMPSISMMLVEDEKITLELLATILARKYPNVNLYTAINGKNGLEIFKTHTPDIVITDINMPDMGGVQMANKIRAIKQDTKIIVLSGDSERLYLQDSVKKGFESNHNIMKPLNFDVLFAAIEECLSEIAQ